MLVKLVLRESVLIREIVKLILDTSVWNLTGNYLDFNKKGINTYSLTASNRIPPWKGLNN